MPDQQKKMKHVRTLLESYIPELKEHMSGEDNVVVFMNIQQIFMLHLNFHRQLSTRKVFNAPQDETEARVRVDVSAFMSNQSAFLAYAYYCTHLEESHKRLEQLSKRKAFRTTVEELNRKLGRKFPLEAQLGVCFQRVLTYPLLLKELKKNTPEEHPDFALVDEALQSMEDVANYINEYKRDAPVLSKINQIKGTFVFDVPIYGDGGTPDLGRHLQDGELQIQFEGTERKERRFGFLFQHALLMCKVRGETHEVKEIFGMNKFFLGEGPSLKGISDGRYFLGKPSFCESFRLTARTTDGVSEMKNCTIYTKSMHLKMKWMGAIDKCIEAIMLNKYDGQLDKHVFKLTTFEQNLHSKCDTCAKFFVGLLSQGYRCDHCDMSAHDACLPQCAPCRSRTRSAYNPPVQRATSQFHNNRRVSLPETGRKKAYTMYSMGTTIEERPCSTHQGKSLDEYTWFAGLLSRNQSQGILQGHPDGSYLIRESEKGGLVLSVQYLSKSYHIKVQEDEHKNVYLTNIRRFSTVEELLMYYRSNSLGTSYPDLPIVLKHLVRSTGLP